MKNPPLLLLALPSAMILSSLQSQAITYTSDTTLTSDVLVENTTDTNAVVVDAASVLTFGSGGSITLKNQGSVSSDGIWTVGVRLSNGAGLVMQQGSISVNDLGNSTPDGKGNDAIVGVQLFGGNTVNVGGSASIHLSSNGGGRSGQFFRVGGDGSTLNVTGGTFIMDEASATASSGNGFNLGGSGNLVNISGGYFELSAGGVAGGGKFFSIGSDAQVTLSGGTFVETVGTNYDGIYFADTGAAGSFTLLGKQLELDTDQDGIFETNVSSGASVSDLKGDFRITFQDDSTWESNYFQQAAGQISFTAIPEASASSALIGISVLSLVVLRRHRG